MADVLERILQSFERNSRYRSAVGRHIDGEQVSLFLLLAGRSRIGYAVARIIDEYVATPLLATLAHQCHDPVVAIRVAEQPVHPLTPEVEHDEDVFLPETESGDEIVFDRLGVIAGE